MAAIDYIVSESSDVFMPSHGGNMGHAIQVPTLSINTCRMSLIHYATTAEHIW